MSDIHDIFQSPLNKTVSDKFMFIMNLPESLKNLKWKYVKNLQKAGIDKNSIVWSLTNVTIPKESIKTQSVPYAGGNAYISTHTKSPYDGLQIQFKVDNKYANYSTIYEWLNFIYNEKHGHYDSQNLSQGMIGLKSYATNIAVVGTDQYNNPVIQWTFTNAFPVDLSQLKLDYQDTSQIVCSCTFMFSQMYIKNFLLSNPA